MNYKKINLSIINAKDTISNNKNSKLYNYLKRNNVAYYYSKVLSSSSNYDEQKIISHGEVFNEEFTKTLKVINSICKNNGIQFLLFKTYKYIPEVVDGDIDIIVRKEDFLTFIKALKEKGFICKLENDYKAECTKRGYKKIEPRVTVEHHGFNIFTEKEIWRNVTEVRIGGLRVLKTKIEFDLFALLLNILYGPSYLKLYQYILYLKVGEKNLLKVSPSDKISFDIQYYLNNILKEDVGDKQFPIFLGNIVFASWWIKRIMVNNDFSLFNKLKHFIFFYYMKYKYLVFNKLQFEHEWSYE